VKLMRIVQRVLCMAWLLNAAAVLAMQPTAVELQSVGASEITLKISRLSAGGQKGRVRHGLRW
jgi:hypothetical protein